MSTLRRFGLISESNTAQLVKSLSKRIENLNDSFFFCASNDYELKELRLRAKHIIADLNAALRNEIIDRSQYHILSEKINREIWE